MDGSKFCRIKINSIQEINTKFNCKNYEENIKDLSRILNLRLSIYLDSGPTTYGKQYQHTDKNFNSISFIN